MKIVKRKKIRKRIIKRTRKKKKENEVIRTSLYIIFERKKYYIERRVN